MAFVYEINGQRVQFDKEPTEQDIDEAAKQLAATPEPVQDSGPVAPTPVNNEAQKNMDQARVAGGIAGGAGAATVGVPTLLGSAKSALTGGKILPQGAGSLLGTAAQRFIGPYGAITSAADAAQRYNTAKSPMDYVQSGISALGAAGYGAGMIPTPVTKIAGPIVGGVTDLMNSSIDRMRNQQYTEIDRKIRDEAARRALQGQQ